MGLFIAMTATSLLYVAMEGWIGLVYPCKRKKEISGATTLRLLEGSDVDRPDKGRESLFDQGEQEFKKEQYININIFYGKYFTGDAFSTSTPFIVF